MDVPWTQIPPEHCGIFRRVLQPKGKSSLGEEFLKTKVTRSNVLSITAYMKEQL
jgi:hypothetical protein